MDLKQGLIEVQVNNMLKTRKLPSVSILFPLYLLTSNMNCVSSGEGELSIIIEDLCKEQK